MSPAPAVRLALLLLLGACGSSDDAGGPGAAPGSGAPVRPPPADGAREAAEFLDRYTEDYVRLHAEWVEADWAANVRIVAGDSTRADGAAAARKAFAAHTGSIESIGHAQRLLERRLELEPAQVRQLRRVLHLAAANPQTVPGLVARYIDADQQQAQDLYGFEFRTGAAEITPNEIDERLHRSTDLEERLAVWEASKEVGAALRPGFLQLRDLRNQVVQALEFPDFYAWQVSDYGMDVQEMNELMERLNRELRPLLRELHTWTRHELAARFGAEVPDMLPAHWLPDRWAQDWSGIVSVEGADLDAALAGRDAEWLVREAEGFYVSLGFEPLPNTFWRRSSLYPVPAGAAFKKNTHASAWHVDLGRDVRSLMSVVPDTYWWETAHHELGHVYYFLAYSRPEVPPLLREGANRAFHEAIGSLLGLASMQRPYLVGRGLLAPAAEVDETALLLREALNHVAFIGFGAGTMPAFEHALYSEELPAGEFNARWWQLAERYQGVVPPSERGEEHADGLSKTHLHDDPAQSYDYALSTVLLFQLHDHIAREILGQDPRATDYYGSAAAGDFLRSLLEPGATRDWRAVTREATGQELSAEPMLRYFAPLQAWLREQNQGRAHTLSDL